MGTMDEKHLELLQELIAGVKDTVKTLSETSSLLAEKVSENDKKLSDIAAQIKFDHHNYPNRVEIKELASIVVNERLNALPKEALQNRSTKVNIFSQILMLIIMLVSLFFSYTALTESKVDKAAFEQNSQKIDQLIEQLKENKK